MCLLLPGEHRSWLELSSSLWINHLIPKNGFTRGCCIQQTPDSPLLLSLSSGSGWTHLKQQAVIKERRSTRQQWTVELSVNPAWYHLSLYLVKRDMHNAGFFYLKHPVIFRSLHIYSHDSVRCCWRKSCWETAKMLLFVCMSYAAWTQSFARK